MPDQKTYTAADFAKADFARRPSGRTAHRCGPDTWQTTLPMEPWTTWWGADADMAADGWVPVTEYTVTAAPTTDEDARRPLTDTIDFAALWKQEHARAEQAERERDDALTMSAMWKETARKLVRDQQPLRYSLRLADRAGDALERRVEEAERERDDARESLREANETVKSLRAMTARELLDAALEAAHVPEDGIIPAGAEYMERYGDGSFYGPLTFDGNLPAVQGLLERRLVDPPTPKRPEGAEEIEAYMRELVASHPEDHYGELADHLASRGVLPPLTDKSEPRRVASEEDAR
ncbi:hypothetical protein C1N80_06295 [Brachybacterium sp. SGAir0954]|uniref:hypothetical protein n=1 Tax=Brachybacterium sp. SGAir0954 TaxID=2571029 RepID=UPI0010CCC2CC|nr:hypothetical protein [Brachybacterium sp. SGAir0954]QCR53230.1 hypothetical protein C1N80_06295 [Brachybacterium sp. SGAir0954]